MKLVRYACSHCGRHFEAEEKEFLECPGCFWSTSVKREEEPTELEKLSGVQTPVPEKHGLTLPWNWKWVLIPVGVLMLGTIVSFAAPYLGRAIPHSAKVPRSGPSHSMTIPAGAIRDGKNPDAGKPQILSDEDKKILERKLEIPEDRPLSEEEQNILNVRAVFQSGLVEKLPSQIWTLENFTAMVAEQQTFYKISLPRSYRKKLTKVFEEKYLPAEEAFRADQLQKARDLWIEALVFPMYGDDIRRHRGVVLTMLRPFINDTLSKIGAVNAILVEREVRKKEEEINQGYQKFLEQIGQKAWPAALASGLELEQRFSALSDPKLLASRSAPPYPPAIGQVDQDIVRTLNDLLVSPPLSAADSAPMRADLEAKKKVIESLIPANLEVQRNRYQEALRLIDGRQWDEAEKELQGIEFPAEWVRDAREKIAVLQKFKNGALDSAGQSG